MNEETESDNSIIQGKQSRSMNSSKYNDNGSRGNAHSTRS